MDKFEIYIEIKGYLVYKNNIYLILKVIMPRKVAQFAAETQIFAFFIDQNQMKLNTYQWYNGITRIYGQQSKLCQLSYLQLQNWGYSKLRAAPFLFASVIDFPYNWPFQIDVEIHIFMVSAAGLLQVGGGGLGPPIF